MDFGADARYVVACASASSHSGRPSRSTASAAFIASCSARGSALPMSSLAMAIMRRVTWRGSTPPSIMRASQYSAASGCEPRTDLWKAEICS